MTKKENKEFNEKGLLTDLRNEMENLPKLITDKIEEFLEKRDYSSAYEYVKKESAIRFKRTIIMSPEKMLAHLESESEFKQFKVLLGERISLEKILVIVIRIYELK